jgi:hypothetical protein
MGVKSTMLITRERAEDLFVDLLTRGQEGSIREIVRDLEDEKLEDLLEYLNDAANGGEGFTNYGIVENPDDY